MARDPMETIMGMLVNQNSVDPNTAAHRKASMSTQRVQSGAEPRTTGKPQPQGQPGTVPMGGPSPEDEGTLAQLKQTIQLLWSKKKQLEHQRETEVMGETALLGEEQTKRKKALDKQLSDIDKAIKQVENTLDAFMAGEPMPTQAPAQAPAPAPSPDQAGGDPFAALGMHGGEQGTETGMTTPDNAIPIVLDALNESILALKVQMSKSQNPEEQQMLEGHIQQLRSQIQQLGGDPIEAEDSIEDGLTQLTGHGYVANEAVTQLAGQSLKDVGQYLGIEVGAQDGKAIVAGQSFDFGNIPHTTFSAQEGRHYVSDPDAFMQMFAPDFRPYEPGHYTDQLSQQDNIYGSDDMSRILQQLGDVKVGAPPRMTLTPEYVNNLINEYGLQPRSQSEIQEHAKAIVDRQRFQLEAQIHRELERFERDHPPEFARAQEQIQQAAQTMSAGMQEEFANRGMYYSSVMANNVGQINAQQMDLIGQIAQEAASHVLELHADLRDIGEWAILEEEVVRRQLEADERVLAQNLLQIQVAVAQHADQMALDTWYRQESLQLHAREQALMELQFKIQEAERAGQHMAAAYLADTPLVQQELRGLGISPEQFAQMPLEQRSYMVRNVMNYIEFDQQHKMNEMNMQAISLNMVLEQRRVDHMIEHDWANFSLAQRSQEHREAVDWASIGLQQQQLNLQSARDAWSRHIAERELEFMEAQKDDEISDRGVEAYLSGLGHLDMGGISAAEGIAHHLRELGEHHYSQRLLEDIYKYRLALDEQNQTDPSFWNNFFRRETRDSSGFQFESWEQPFM